MGWVDEAKQKINEKGDEMMERLMKAQDEQLAKPNDGRIPFHIPHGIIMDLQKFYLKMLGDLQKTVKELFESRPRKYDATGSSRKTHKRNRYSTKEIDDWFEKAEKLLEATTK